MGTEDLNAKTNLEDILKLCKDEYINGVAVEHCIHLHRSQFLLS